LKVKICGIMNEHDALLCESLGADALGFVHFPMRSRSIPIESIEKICSKLGPMTTKVLVCAPKTADEAVDLVKRCNVDTIQLYSLSPKEITVVRAHGIKTIRAILPVRADAIRYADSADALLFESGMPGQGKSYDYSKIPFDCCSRVIIAGGLNPENLHTAKKLKPYALDVSSGVERKLGMKDPALVAEFIRRCKQ